VPGHNTSFPLAVKLEDERDGLCHWVEWPDKAARMQATPKSNPIRHWPTNGDGILSGKRLIYGGFSNIIDL